MERAGRQEMSPGGCSATAADGTRSRGLGGRERVATASQSSAGLPAAPAEPACPRLPGHVRCLLWKLLLFIHELRTQGVEGRAEQLRAGGSQLLGVPVFRCQAGDDASPVLSGIATTFLRVCNSDLPEPPSSAASA